MRVDIVTIFPELFGPHLTTGLLGKAIEQGVVEVSVHDLRDRGLGKHRSVDDEPYGGGAGMVMRPEPIFEAVEALRRDGSFVILLSAKGDRFTHDHVVALAERSHLILICGRYEGVDERVAEHLADLELSIGDFVLMGGELPALVVIEAVTRFVPGVLGNPESIGSESYVEGVLEHPHYTRPADYRGMKVPEVLLSGDHAAVERWRREQSERATRERRPDLHDHRGP
jgi:tRNA (guanine37-N1)-methyltransferase